jgi:hypothetical protein
MCNYITLWTAVQRCRFCVEDLPKRTRSVMPQIPITWRWRKHVQPSVPRYMGAQVHHPATNSEKYNLENASGMTPRHHNGSFSCNVEPTLFCDIRICSWAAEGCHGPKNSFARVPWTRKMTTCELTTLFAYWNFKYSSYLPSIAWEAATFRTTWVVSRLSYNVDRTLCARWCHRQVR